jgi:hypothetical protein
MVIFQRRIDDPKSKVSVRIYMKQIAKLCIGSFPFRPIHIW